MKTNGIICNAMLKRRGQVGAALIVSLVFLLVISIIAVAGMRTTRLQERMAGNTRDRNLAFQAAESGIREAETFIEGLASLGSFDGSNGLHGLTDAEPSHYDATVWSVAANHVTADESYGSYASPRYFIKHWTTVTGEEGAMNISGYGDNKGTGDVTIFKITGRGTGGGLDSAEVMLRSRYGRAF